MLPVGSLPVVEVLPARTELTPVRSFSEPESVTECRPGLLPVVAAVLEARVRAPYELALVLLEGPAGSRPALRMAELLQALGPASPDALSRLSEVSRAFRHEFAAAASLALMLHEAHSRLPPPPLPVADAGLVGGLVHPSAPALTVRRTRPRLPPRRRAR